MSSPSENRALARREPQPVTPDRRFRFVLQPVDGAEATEPQTASGEQPFDLSHYLWLLRRHLWKIAAFTALCTLGSYIVCLRLPPVFEATAWVDIDRQSPPGIIGQDAARSTLNDSDQFLATQVRLIQSDAVLRPVVSRFNLLEHEGATKDLAKKTLQSVRNAPVVLRNLRISRSPNTYLLLISYRSHDAKLAADVANAVAQSYIDHTYQLRYAASTSLSRFMERQLEELKAKMERSTAALSGFERELNVINPEEKTSILSARLLQLNTEFTNAQADRVRRQAAAQAIAGGSLEAALSSGPGDSLRRLVDHLGEARERFAQVKAHYGSNHPEYRKAAGAIEEVQALIASARQLIAKRVGSEYSEAVSREQMLGAELAATKKEFDRINARSFEYQALKREAEGDKNLYDELLRRIREAGINSSFQNSSIRMADAARPGFRPVFPRPGVILSLTFLFSLLIALAAAVLADLFDKTVRDPEDLTRRLRVSVIGTLPWIRTWQRQIAPAVAEVREAGRMTVPASESDHAFASFAESIRTLRNSILLADIDRRVRTLLVTSAFPSEGKSTTAAHLAATHAEQGRKTLLIDGDLRKPSVHRSFEFRCPTGLSNVVLGELEWREALTRQEAHPNLDILGAGAPSRRASDLVGSCIAELLEEASREYDLVILDAPPMLGFAEPLAMARAVDGVLVVARSGGTDRDALRSVVGTLQRVHANILGVVLNQMSRTTGDRYHYYGKYYRNYAQAEG